MAKVIQDFRVGRRPRLMKGIKHAQAKFEAERAAIWTNGPGPDRAPDEPNPPVDKEPVDGCP